MSKQPKPVPTVYVLDDDRTVCESIEGAIESIGLPVEIFTDAECFFDHDLRDLAGCIVLDIRMPGMDGLGVQKQLQAQGCEMPIIFVSAFGDVWTVVQVMKSGAYDFFEKPFSSQELLSSVQGAIRKNTQSRRKQAGRRAAEEKIQNLTPREREVLKRVGSGLSSKQIASDLGISIRTVEVHRANLKQKLGIHSREAITKLAISIFDSGSLRNLSQRPAAYAE